MSVSQDFHDAREALAELDSWREDAARLLCSAHLRENIPDATPDEVSVVAKFQRCDLCDRLTEVRWIPSRQRIRNVPPEVVS